MLTNTSPRLNTKGPRLSREQAEAHLARQERLQDAWLLLGLHDYVPSRAFRILRAYQSLTSKDGHWRFTITGPPTPDARELARWARLRPPVVAIAPCGTGWRAILLAGNEAC